MLIKHPSKIPTSEITPESAYKNRRQFIGQSLGAIALMQTALVPGLAQAGYKYEINDRLPTYTGPDWLEGKLHDLKVGPYATDEKLTPYLDVARYNNFYEFGTSKLDPVDYSQEFKTDPWSVEIAGECDKPGTYQLEDLMKSVDIEERLYRLRCVEAWSMVVPWVGFSLADLLKRFAPNSKAKYVEFTTLHDPEQMPGQRSNFSIIPWPYVEGLRIDEAMHPLTILAVGVYGRSMPPQNGAPLRLVVPWKYGFKSIKSIVKIRFTEQAPVNSWQHIASDEYGFYANVNPEVDHPRWSQKYERRLPSSFLSPGRRKTELFNGYGEEVASLYQGMDLTKWY